MSRDRGPVSHALLPLYVGREFPLVTALSVYLDESAEGGTYAIAGYVGPLSTWDEMFSPCWARVLLDAPHRITEFKASDCRQLRGEFTGWSRHEADALTRDLVSVLLDDNCSPRIAGVGMAALFPSQAGTPKKSIGNAIHMACLRNVIAEAMVLSEGIAKGDKVQFVCDVKPGLEGKISKAYETIRAQLQGTRFANMAGRMAFGESTLLAPLQAADLLAYETASRSTA